MLLTSNVPEFPILKKEEPLPFRYLLQASDRFVGPVIYDIGMGFEHAYVVADFFCDAQEVIGGVDIGGYAEVGAFDGDEAEEVGR